MFLIRRRSCYSRSFVREAGAGVAFGYAVRLVLGATAAPVLAVCACGSFVFWGGDLFLWLSLAHPRDLLCSFQKMTYGSSEEVSQVFEFAFRDQLLYALSFLCR